jgi:NAD(P)-dependent dehydrogenase (short-subunit alcohol dehydrogenase family)
MIITSLFLLAVSALNTGNIWTASCNSSTTATEMLESIKLDLTGKIILTTGGDGHIASEFNLALVKANATVILACHSQEKCDAAAATLIKETGMPATRVETQLLDLSSKVGIRAMAARVIALHNDTGLYALVNSASGGSDSHLTSDGLVQSMEINLLGHALLTDLLLPLLRGNAQREKGRVVNVAAAVYGNELKCPNNSLEYLTNVTKQVDPYLAATRGYFGLAKYLFIHHASEVALRERDVIAMSVNPGYALGIPGVP